MPFQFAHIPRPHFCPHAMPRNFEGLTLKYCRRQYLRRAAPTMRAFAVNHPEEKRRVPNVDFGAVEGLVVRQQTATFAVGHSLGGGCLCRHSQLPPLFKLPRRQGLVCEAQILICVAPPEKIRRIGYPSRRAKSTGQDHPGAKSTGRISTPRREGIQAPSDLREAAHP